MIVTCLQDRPQKNQKISKEIFFHEVTKGKLTVLIKIPCHFLCSRIKHLDNDEAHFILIFHSKLFFLVMPNPGMNLEQNMNFCKDKVSGCIRVIELVE
jgi:hypothetical protein